MSGRTLPFILDEPEQVMEVVRQAHRHGARYVLPLFGVTLRDRQREYFYRKLEERMPGMSKRSSWSCFDGAMGCGMR